MCNPRLGSFTYDYNQTFFQNYTWVYLSNYSFFVMEKLFEFSGPHNA